MMASSRRAPVIALIPPAGCGAGYFRRLRRALGPQVVLHTVELPGHGRRYAEPPMTSAEAVVGDVEAQMPSLVDAVYGESLGSYIGLATLAARRTVNPLLIAASNSAPSARVNIDLDEIDSPEGAIAVLSAIGGEVPPELLEDPSLAEQAHQLIRSDLLLSQEFIDMTRDAVVAGDLCVLAGDDDPAASRPEAWAAHARRTCHVSRIPGTHLLSGSNPRGVADAIVTFVEKQA